MSAMSDHTSSNGTQVPERAQSPPRRLRACLQCMKAKARCHYESHDVSIGCNRCQRLDVTCALQTTKSQRRPRQIKAKKNAMQVAILPSPALKSPDNLCGDNASTSAAKQPPVPVSTSEGSPLLPTWAETRRTEPSIAPKATSSILQQQANGIPHHPKNTNAKPISIADGLSSPGFGLTWDLAESVLSTFIHGRTAHYPFIILDHDVTTRRLFAEKPLLFRAILLIASDITLAKGREIKRSINAWIGQHLLVLDSCSLGSLQGLLVLIAWSSPDFYCDGKATQLMYFSIGLAHRLGITRTLPVVDGSIAEDTKLVEECRTFLACYYLLSCSSRALGRSNPLDPYHADKCLEVLERAAEFQTDFLAAKMVRYRLCVEKVSAIYLRIGNTSCSDLSSQIFELKRDIEDLMRDVSWKHPKFFLIWTLQNNAMMQLLLPMSYHTFPKNSDFSRLQLKCLEICRELCHESCRMFRSVSVTGVCSVPFTAAQDILTIGISMLRLSLLDMDGWDIGKTRELIDISDYFDGLIATIGKALKVRDDRVASTVASNPSSYKPDGPDEGKGDTIWVLYDKLQIMKDWFESQLPCQQSPGGAESEIRNTTPKYKPVAASLHDKEEWTIRNFFESIVQLL
ncbi:hypothetical protein F5Y16DRAFT_356193 [Xylariaceae sp. FL0255]|nr:hypothetical protein F5Y16DRAFT_356193 [Xylariaceae sp. FL0255]